MIRTEKEFSRLRLSSRIKSQVLRKSEASSSLFREKCRTRIDFLNKILSRKRLLGVKYP